MVRKARRTNRQKTGRTDSGWDDQDRDDLPRWVGGNFEKLRLGQLTQVGPFRRLDGLPRASTMYGKIGCYRATYLPMYLSSRMQALGYVIEWRVVGGLGGVVFPSFQGSRLNFLGFQKGGKGRKLEKEKRKLTPRLFFPSALSLPEILWTCTSYLLAFQLQSPPPLLAAPLPPLPLIDHTPPHIHPKMYRGKFHFQTVSVKSH